MSKWGLDHEFEQNPIERILSVKDRWKKAKQDLEDAKYLEDLIHKDYITAIKQYATAWDYRLPTIKSAVDELKITDKRRKRHNLDCLNSWIKDEFFPEVDVEIKVNKITSYGYESYTWQMDFEIEGETYAICVPNKHQIYMENAEHAYYGQFAFMHRTSESSISVEHTNYDIEDMAKYIKNYFDGTVPDFKDCSICKIRLFCKGFGDEGVLTCQEIYQKFLESKETK